MERKEELFVEKATLRIIEKSLGSIEKSLSSLAEDTKARRDNQEKIMQQMVGFEEAVQDLRNDPFGLKAK